VTDCRREALLVLASRA
jgi:hypothetical protein